jgi:hypothetical protein
MGVCMRVCVRVCVRPTHNVEDMSAQIKPGLFFVVVHGQRVWVQVQGARTEPSLVPPGAHVGAGPGGANRIDLVPPGAHNDRACRRAYKGT